MVSDPQFTWKRLQIQLDAGRIRAIFVVTLGCCCHTFAVRVPCRSASQPWLQRGTAVRIVLIPFLLLTGSVVACGSENENDFGTGGTGAPIATGGPSGGSPATGATPATGGLVQGATGGVATGGSVTGGFPTGGLATGGVAIGGGGVSQTGGTSSGGATGGWSTGGAGATPSTGGVGAESSTGGAGAVPATGGMGATPSTGGADPTGGAPATGGVTDTGGAPGTGGGPITDSLREKYEAYFAIGAAIDTQYGDYTSILDKHFNSVTCENEMKFDALQPSEGNFSYGTADQMVDFAQGRGMQVRGHALVWHRQTPSWVFSGGRDMVLQRMRNHIENVMQHFQGRVGTWDVVNEAIMDDGSFRTGSEPDADQQSQWYATIGEDNIARAFRYACEADLSAKLFYNDYYNYHPVRQQAIYDMLAGLVADGVPIDGVGLQCHLNLEPGTDPNEQSYYQTVENLETAIEMYSSLGLEVQITELDLSLYLRGITYTPDMFYTEENVTDEILQQQAERYRAFFEVFRAHYDVITSVTFWGIADDNTWLSEFSSGRKDFPLLFDDQHQPKPAFDAVMDF
jgi:endo-1,4-beta-xylanase